MTALTAGRILTTAGEGTIVGPFDVASGAVIYKGAICVLDTADDRLKPAADATTTKFVGLAWDSHGSEFPVTGVATAGERMVSLLTDVQVLLPTTAVVLADVTAQVAAYAADDATATDQNTLGPQIGRFVKYVDATSAWVYLGQPALANAV